MDARQDLDLFSHLGSLLSGSVPLESFRQWFANALWDLEESADDDTVEFAYLLENRLAEYSGGYITEGELVAGLRADVAKQFGSKAGAVGSVSTGQSGRTVAIGTRAPVVVWRAGSSVRTLQQRITAVSPGPATLAVSGAGTSSSVTLGWVLSAGARPVAAPG